MNVGSSANIRVATSSSWKDKSSGENQERTEWHRIVLYNRLGEIAGEYLKKGSKVYVEGSLRTSKWQDQNGNDRYTTEILCVNIQMLDVKPINSDAMSSDSVDFDKKSFTKGSKTEDSNDDIPF